MEFDEFSSKLRMILKEYETKHGKPCVSIEDLEKYLDSRLRRPKSRGLKSLKGLSL